ncbi:hypothetical protein H5410_057482, partial [Solanum commersonii]
MTPNDPLQHKSVTTINTIANIVSYMCFRFARERGRKTKTTKLMASGVGRHEVQLERVNPSPMSTHSARESEWVNVKAVLYAANGCPRETHLKR